VKKRWLLGAVVLSLGMVLSACEKIKQSEVKPTILTAREEMLVEIFQAGADGKLFDYEVNQSIGNFEVNVWKLNQEGEWEENGEISRPLEEIKGDFTGKIAVLPNSDHTKIKLVLQEVTGTGAYVINLAEKSKMTGWGSAFLQERQPLEPGKEVPLCILYGTTKNSIETFDVTSYFDPKDRLVHGEEVYAVTILSDGEIGSEEKGGEKQGGK